MSDAIARVSKERRGDRQINRLSELGGRPSRPTLKPPIFRLALVLLILASTCVALGDEIELKDGRRFTGQIVLRSDSLVKLRIPAGRGSVTMAFYTTDVKSISTSNRKAQAAPAQDGDSPARAVDGLSGTEGRIIMWCILGLGLAVLVVLIGSAMVRVVVVEEATAVAFKHMGGFKYCAMQFSGHHFDAMGDGDIVQGSGRRKHGSCWCIWRIGGWVFYLRPFVQPVQYGERKGPRDDFGHGVYVNLNDVTPQPNISKAETAAPENVGLDVRFVSTMRIVNPYKWLFRSPTDAREQAVKRLDAILRGWVRSGDQRHAQRAKGNGALLWKELEQLDCLSVVRTIEEDWGLRVLEKSVIVEDLSYSKEYQEVLEKPSKAGIQAEADVTATTGRVMMSVALQLGMSLDDLKKNIEQDPGFVAQPAYQDALRFAQDLVKRDRAAESGELIDYRFGNTDGTPFADQGLGGIIGGLAAAARQYGSRGIRGHRRDPSGAGRRYSAQDMEDEIRRLQEEDED